MFKAFILILFIAVFFFFSKKKKSPQPHDNNLYYANEFRVESGQYNYREINKEIKKIFHNHPDLIASLVFVARADGRMMQKELDAVAEIIADLSSGITIPIHFLSDDIKDIPKINPGEFEGYLERIAAVGKAEIGLFLNGYKSLVAESRSRIISPGIAYCLDAIKRVFGDMSPPGTGRDSNMPKNKSADLHAAPPRIACSDGKCTGIIGEDGHCGSCGKHFTWSNHENVWR